MLFKHISPVGKNNTGSILTMKGIRIKTFHSMTQAVSPLELEINERLYLRALHLNYKVDHGNQQQRFPYKRKPDDSFAAGMFPTVRYEMEEKAERHQGKHFPIALHQLGEKPGTESCEYLVQHIQRSGEVGIAEEYPTETNEVERDYNAEEAADAMTALSLFPAGDAHPELMGCQRNTMQHPPKNKIPGCAMPQATQKHGDDEISVLPYLPLTVAAQGYIEVIAQPTGKRDMPAAPELRYGCRLIGRVEVHVEMKAQQQSNADSHIAISGEVAIDLKRIAVNTHEVFHARIQSRIIKDTLHKVDADIIRNNRFLEKTAYNQEDSLSEHLLRDKQRTADLRDKVACTHDGACHQLREERYIESIVQQVGEGRYLFAIHIDRIAQRLESEERDADRKKYVHCGKRAACQRSKEPAEEIRIFKVAQQSQVYQQTDRHPRFTLPAYGGPFHEPGNEKVAYRNNGKQEEISAAAFIVEIVRKQGDEHQAGSSATLQKQIEHDESGKQPQEDTAAEYHRRMRVVHQQVMQAGEVYIQFVQKFVNIPHLSVTA